jgi:uncharacterized protein YbjT (DUF2867 family)
MNIICGATGQVGSHLTKRLLAIGSSAIAIARNPEKIQNEKIQFRQADLLNPDQVVEAFKGGTTVFLLTPENPNSDDIIRDTTTIISNYKKAILVTSVWQYGG